MCAGTDVTPMKQLCRPPVLFPMEEPFLGEPPSHRQGILRALLDLPRHECAPETDGAKGMRIAARVQASLNAKATYIATHDRCDPPPSQIVTTERQNVLLRQFHARADKKRDRARRSGGSEAAEADSGRSIKKQK